jgi:hypothetical protein
VTVKPVGPVTRGGRAVLAVTLTNPNTSAVSVTRVRVCLPRGFSFVARSTKGAVRKAPKGSRCGTGRTSVQLMWGPVRVPAGTAVTFRFTVRTGSTSGRRLGSVSAVAADGFAVTSSALAVRVATRRR